MPTRLQFIMMDIWMVAKNLMLSLLAEDVKHLNVTSHASFSICNILFGCIVLYCYGESVSAVSPFPCLGLKFGIYF